MGPKISEEMIGRIKSVYCKDFVSYNEITYYPKKYLNVLTGPNGTGKSTIVSAIILGLGGEPNLLNRSSSITDYIQSHKTQALIKIQIYGRHKNKVESFSRTINQNGSSKFGVNGNAVPKKTFLAAVSSYNIQVSNLCQFLPQDRVQDFSKMNPQELLLNTMSSVCDDELTTAFQQLKEMRAKQISANSSNTKEKASLLKKEKRLEQLQMTVTQHRDREDLLLKVKIYTAKKLCIEVKSGENKCNHHKNELKDANKQYQISENNFNALKRARDNITKQGEIFTDKFVKCTDLIAQSMIEKNRLDKQLETSKQNIKDKKMNLEKNVRQISKHDEEINKLTHLLSTKETEMEQFNENKSDILAELENHKSKILLTRQLAIDQYNKRKELETKLNEEKIPELTSLRHKIERLQNVKSQKMEEMKVKNPSIVKAMEWIAQNRHRYKCNIYDPMIFELNITFDGGAKYLENVVKQRDLYAFSCEDKNVMSELINELCVKQRLSVNIIYCAPADRCLYKPTIPLDKIRSMGFHSYLVDIVSGPPAIINKLCSSNHIHNIPIGRDEVGKFNAVIPKSIRVYFGGSKIFSRTSSLYSTNIILTEVQLRGKNYLISIDTKQLASLQKRCDEVLHEQDSIKNFLGTVDRKFETLQLTLRDEGESKKKIEQKILYFKNLENEIKNLKKQSVELKQTIASIDSLKRDFRHTVIIEIKKMLETESKLIKKIEEINNLRLERRVAKAKESLHILQHANQEEALKDGEDAVKKAKILVDKLTKLIDTEKQALETKKEAIRRLCDDKTENCSDFPFKQHFINIGDISLDEANELLHNVEGRLECMKNINTNILAEYEQLQLEVNQIKEQIAVSLNEGKSVEDEINAMFIEWEPKLINLIDAISFKFSAFMESIDYVGEVVLTNSNKYDFDSYGIQIMVQYRKGSQLQMLDKYVQSGGERAVAIAIYSLSLQHIIHVPFRCVDEINQGMDSKNERRIFDLLLKEATKKGSAQYLFVTPKLLRDLNYNEHLCISIVHNSKTIQSDGTLFPII